MGVTSSGIESLTFYFFTMLQLTVTYSYTPRAALTPVPPLCLSLVSVSPRANKRYARAWSRTFSVQPVATVGGGVVGSGVVCVGGWVCGGAIEGRILVSAGAARRRSVGQGSLQADLRQHRQQLDSYRDLGSGEG